jgi:WXG100 family type VII secretion target
MADRILMTPQELNDGATYLRQRLDAMVNEAAMLDSRINDVASQWEGASEQAFMARYTDELRPVLKETMPLVINALADKLDAAANTIRDTDAQIASAFRG